MAYEIEQLNGRIDAQVNTNGNKAITGAVLNGVLKDIADTLGHGRSYAGLVSPDSAEPEHDDLVFYIANEKGTYFPDAQFPVNIEYDGFYIVYWHHYIGKWRLASVMTDNISIAVLNPQELVGKYVGDTNHEKLSDNRKLRVIVMKKGRIMLYSGGTEIDDIYMSVPLYDSDASEMNIHAIYVKKSRNAGVGGYPYREKKLTISGVTEEDI